MRSLVLPSLVVALAAVAGIGAQQAPQTQAPAVFRTGTERVRLDVIALDRGKPIAGLTAADFEVLDNGARVEQVELVQTDDRVSVAVALDVGYELRGRVIEDFIDELTGAGEELAAALQPGDSGWLLVFDKRVALKAGPMLDRGAVKQALAGWRRHRGSSMWDALYGTIARAEDPTTRSLAMVFSAGLDSSSWSGADRVLAALRRSDVAFSIIRPRHAIEPWGSPINSFNQLEDAALASGGVIIKVERGQKLGTQFVNLLNEFRQGYVLSYAVPTVRPRADGWHDVKVRLTNRKGTVRVRPGYFERGR